MPAGRPRLLTAEMIEDVARILPTMPYLEPLSDYLGVHRTLLYQWIRRGRREADRMAREGGITPVPNEAIFFELYYQVQKCRAESELTAIGVITKAATGYRREEKVVEERDEDGQLKKKTTLYEYVEPDWRAAAWKLEKTKRKRYGKRRYIDPKEAGQAPDPDAPLPVEEPDEAAVLAYLERYEEQQRRAEGQAVAGAATLSGNGGGKPVDTKGGTPAPRR
jgi:hypothetical protein